MHGLGLHTISLIKNQKIKSFVPGLQIKKTILSSKRSSKKPVRKTIAFYHPKLPKEARKK